jgi:heptosyltransferase-2
MTLRVSKILFISLSNIGDVILSLPGLDYLKAIFPQAKITVMAGPQLEEIFINSSAIDNFIAYDKRLGLKEKVKLFNSLSRQAFDLVVDLRNSFFGALLPAKYRTSPFLRIPDETRHMRDRHLARIRYALGKQKEPLEAIKSNFFLVKADDRQRLSALLPQNSINEQDTLIVIAAGAKSHIKRWPRQKFAELSKMLVSGLGAKVVLVGDRNDTAINEYIALQAGGAVIDLGAKTTIETLAILLRKARLLISNDSAVLHLASYINTPVVALFGPTNEIKYGPWPEKCAVVKKDIFCRPCEKAQCRFGSLACMNLIRVEDVFRQVERLSALPAGRPQVSEFKRILVARSDRIGDVLLSTSVIRNLREHYPAAYIAMMVAPYAKEIVEGNPWLDEVIIYDKDGKHKSWRRSLKFAHNLKKRKFDLALVLHPTKRVHLVTFLAGIKRRIGYARKFGFLLTDKIEHTKQYGLKHEMEYSLDLLRPLGIIPKNYLPFMPLRLESETWAKEFLRNEGIKDTDNLLAVHPGASCPSKLWPVERFAQAADRLVEKYGLKVLVVAGPKDIEKARSFVSHMRNLPLDLAGRLSVSQLASILKRCRLLISNDSGPVHIAAAVGAPVVAIFGRAQKGLSPQRWGPLGGRSRVLHKEVGCLECLAHNCKKDFACLKAITVEDVLNAAEGILQSVEVY